MPTIEINLKDLERIIEVKLPRTAESLDSVFECVKAEVEEVKGDNVKLEIKGNDRPDTWNVEGIARQMRGQLEKELGLKKYTINKSNLELIAKDVKVRPYIACAVVKGVKITLYILEQLIQEQEKIHGTYGRNRRKASVGLYNFDMLTFPLKYELTSPETSFVPLGWTEEASLAKILKEHEKGVEYGNILKGQKKFPIFKDSEGKILSLPPIINSNDLGNVGTETKNILIEVTGTDWKVVKNVLNIMTLSLADRGGKIYSVKIRSPNKPGITPEISIETIEVNLEDINSHIGMNFTAEAAAKLLKRARYGVEVKKNKFLVEVPSYRTDIMHAVDIIEDVAIVYGYNKFVVDPPRLYTLGGLSKKTKFSNKIREAMIGFGLQEVMTFTLVSKEVLSSKVNLSPKATEVLNPINKNYTSLRNALIPTMLEFLSKNTHNKFPQRVFEVGTAIQGVKDVEKLACLITHDQANYTEVKSVLVALANNLGVEIEVKPVKHPTFIEGRVGEILLGGKHLGIIGEISPKVLENWGLEKAVIGFEISLEEF